MHYKIRPYTTGELARLYGISKITFNKWLEPYRAFIGERRGHFYTALQVKFIFKKLGPPSTEVNEE